MKDIAFFDAPAGSTRQRKRSNLKSKHSNIRIWRRAGDGWDTPTIEVVSPSGRVVEARHEASKVWFLTDIEEEK